MNLQKFPPQGSFREKVQKGLFICLDALAIHGFHEITATNHITTEASFISFLKS